MLIVVMAGASGIKGSDFPIIVMKFKAGSEMKSERETRINIVEAQLMSDKLKDYDYSVNTNRVLITKGKKEKSGKRASLKKDGEVITNKEKKEESEPSRTSEKQNKPVAPVSEEGEAEAGKEKVERTGCGN